MTSTGQSPYIDELDHHEYYKMHSSAGGASPGASRRSSTSTGASRESAGVTHSDDEDESQSSTEASFLLMQQSAEQTFLKFSPFHEKVISEYEPSNDLAESHVLLEEPEGDSNFFWSLYNLVADIITPGVVAIPFFFMNSGAWFSFLFFPFVAALSCYTLQLTRQLAKKHRCTTFLSLARLSLGTPGMLMACACAFLFNFGSFSTGLIMIGSNLPKIIENITGTSEHWWCSRAIVIVASAIVVLPAAFLKNIGSYAFLSFLFVMLLAGTCLIVTAYGVRTVVDDGTPNLSFFGPNVFYSIGGVSFAFVCHDISLSIASELKRCTRARWAWLTVCATGITCVLFLLFGLFGHIYELKTEVNILDGLPSSGWLPTLARAMHCLAIVLTVPYVNFMPRLAVLLVIAHFFPALSVTHRAREVQHYAVTVTIVAAGCGLALLVTNLGAAYSIIGAVAACGLGFILPALMFLALERAASLPLRALNAAVLLLGVALMLLGCVSPFVNLQAL